MTPCLLANSGTGTLTCALGFSPSRRPLNELEGAPSFASFAKGGLLHSDVTHPHFSSSFPLGGRSFSSDIKTPQELGLQPLRTPNTNGATAVPFSIFNFLFSKANP